MNAVDTLATVGTISTQAWDDACDDAMHVASFASEPWQDDRIDEEMTYDCRFEAAVAELDAWVVMPVDGKLSITPF